MLFQENKLLIKLFQNKKVLEIGCNQGLTSVQISRYANLTMSIDNNKKHISTARKNPKKNITYKCINFYNKKKMQSLGRYDVIYLREIFNFINLNQKIEIIKILKSNLKKNGQIIVTDFYTSVFTRKKILNFFQLDFKSIFKININAKKFHLKDQNSIKVFFHKLNFSSRIMNKDPVNKHLKTSVKILEFLYPCKYTVILKRNY